MSLNRYLPEGNPRLYTVKLTATDIYRIKQIIRYAQKVEIDHVSENLSFVDFLMDVPISKLVPGEETYAEQHVGTQYASRSTGKPINATYSPRKDDYMIFNGHHRWAEAKARKELTTKAKVSIENIEKGFGTYTLNEMKARRWL